MSSPWPGWSLTLRAVASCLEVVVSRTFQVWLEYPEFTLSFEQNLLAVPLIHRLIHQYLRCVRGSGNQDDGFVYHHGVLTGWLAPGKVHGLLE